MYIFITKRTIVNGIRRKVEEWMDMHMLLNFIRNSIFETYAYLNCPLNRQWSSK